MERQKLSRYQQQFLLLNTFILIPIALSYGFIPEGTFDLLFGIEMDVTTTNVKHFMRVIMGLYLSMIGLWILGSRLDSFRIPALYAQVFFMFGVAFGRLISFTLDGMPFWIFISFFVFEILLGTVGVILIRK